MNTRSMAVVAALTLIAVGVVLASGATARDPSQAIMGDAELGTLPPDEQRRLGDLEQGQDGLVLESLPDDVRERLAEDDDPNAELHVLEGHDDTTVLRRADVTITLPEGFNGTVLNEGPLWTSPEPPAQAADGARAPGAGPGGSPDAALPPAEGDVTLAMYELLHPEGGGNLSMMIGVGQARANAIQAQLATHPDAQPMRIGDYDVIRTGPPDSPHLQWVTPGGTVISLATQDFDDNMIEAIVLGVDSD